MLRLTLRGSKLSDTIRAKIPKVLSAIENKLNALVIALQAKIVGEKLDGQVLNIRSGKLANSIRVIPASAGGTRMVASVQGAGGPAYYGAYHEDGTENSYIIRPINKQALAFMLGGKLIIRKAVLHPPIKKRSFMRSSLDEMRAQIISDLQAAVNEAIAQ